MRTNLILIALIVLALGTGRMFAGPGDLDTTFAGSGKLRLGFITGDDTANAMAAQADGKLIVVGSTPNGSGTDYLIIRYNVDGSPDNSFGALGRVVTGISNGRNDVATAVVIQPDGKIVVAGHSEGDGSNQDFSLVRLNADGSFDSTFGIGGKRITAITNFPDVANAMVIQADGKIVLGGHSFTNMSNGDFALLRYNSNGTVDTTFGNEGIRIVDASMGGQQDSITGMVILPDGKLFAVGRGEGISYFVRYLSNGSPDSSWGLLGNGILNQRYGQSDGSNAVALQPDGKVVVAGVSDGKFLLIRFTNTGLDLTFNGNGRVITPIGTGFTEAKAVMVVGGFTVQRIVVAGYTNTGNQEDFALARFNLNGSLDPLFNGTGTLVTSIGSGDDRAHSILSHVGLIAVAGFSSNGSNDDLAVARFTSAGAPDTQFDTDGKRTEDIGFRNALASGVAVQPDGKVVTAGFTETNSGSRDYALARHNPNGSLDTSFDGDGRVTTDFGGTSEEARSVVVQPDGKIIVAGSRLDPGAGSNDYVVARYNVDGSPDMSFNGNGLVIAPVGPGNDEAAAVAIQTDGKIVVAGTVKLSETNTDFGVMRFNTNGSPDASFNGTGKVLMPIGIRNDTVTAVKVQNDGKIVVGGYANNTANEDFAVARLTTTGQPDNSFGSFGRQVTPIGPMDEYAFGLALQPDGKVVLSGYTVNGTTGDTVVVRYTPAGQPDPTFDNDGIARTRVGLIVSVGTGVAVQPDGKIVTGGVAAIGTQLDFAASRFSSNGSIDDSYGIAGSVIADITGVNDFGWAMTLDPSGRAVIAGDADGLFGIARLTADLAPRRTPFDFDGDSKTDVSIFRPSLSEWWVLRSSDGGNFAAQFGVSTDKLVPADFTGDGKTDIAFWRPSTGEWFVLRSEDRSFFAFPFGTSGDIPVPADYDGDNKDDAAVFRPSNGTWFVLRSSDAGTTITQFGAVGDQPVPADYDGDGKADIAIRRPSNGEWWLNRSSAGVLAMRFGTATDRTVPGDYTGDGKADVAFWRPSTGEWFVVRSEDRSFFAFPFGMNGDIPAPGDYDGDGKVDATVYRPSGSTWFVNKTSGGVLTIPFGAAGDAPVPNAFVR